ncbi:MAG: AmmeMemoRadiSam system protein B [Candidatus Raymondbacteria bacterium RifOxyA12_full_50_37]|uniref:MEMO1 family protein A2519_12690 n=1 Tax=Candidatus Raymondbacteria bacterium RIFOXYD12_FULL_49_13 TaxID=1817890 RepID=A0A1F7F2K9_UNCRA|nr:MAG: AmmeMemoRadiSam system protein B [Candidatus Raymondbacteria bacterium RifOxyA12_full_50_37]OGJ97292.1 MAG: AmmeMemoRadiSam system protein B [Candidatus Raymondbacteria bacterium RIFOXYC2_FULL_50_21]OGK00905.1 MAG: AmmeMemoRadiSam system protein B [Candidatus Raymondbacteria bacterium RIFOXYD12_FULL_49_13]
MKGGSAMVQDVFPCNGAGRWFPADKAGLQSVVDNFLAQAKVQSHNPLAVVAPHAGYAYSGAGAGLAYKALAGHEDIRRVIIIGPSHSASFEGVSVLSGFKNYETPLGLIKIDTDACEALLDKKHFCYKKEAHAPEHSVENQIPFIQRALPGASIVPCVAGFLFPDDFAEIGATFRTMLDGKTVIAVSSDFTHYGASFGYVPFAGDIRNNLEKLDGKAIQKIEAADTAGFLEYIEKTGATICGRIAIGVMCSAIAGMAKGRLLKYYTSSDDSGDFSHTVCYASIVMEKV